jgi:hypothetical protein
VKNAARFYMLHALASLENGQSDQALRDIQVGLKLSDSVRDEPLLMSLLVRTACNSILLQPVWQGMANRQWNEKQLAELQEELLKRTVLTDYERQLYAEGALFYNLVDTFNRNRMSIQPYMAPDDDKWDMNDNIYLFCPSGWFQQTKVLHAQIYMLAMADAFKDLHRTESERVFKRPLQHLCENAEQWFEDSRQNSIARAMLNPTQLILYALVPSTINVAPKAVRSANQLNLAVLACALERYQLQNGKYPEHLTALVPQYLQKLPMDTVTGRDMIYKPTADGRFMIYSVGYDGVDNGGVDTEVFDRIHPNKTIRTKNIPRDQKPGDWVWKYTPDAALDKNDKVKAEESEQ